MMININGYNETCPYADAHALEYINRERQLLFLRLGDHAGALSLGLSPARCKARAGQGAGPRGGSSPCREPSTPRIVLRARDE